MRIWLMILIVASILIIGGFILLPRITATMQPDPLPESIIVGVDDVDQAVQWFEANGFQVRQIIRPIRAVAVTGDVSVMDQGDWRYIEPDPPDAVHIADGPELADILDYGVDNIQGDLVWGHAEDATDVIPGEGGAGVKLAVIDTGIDCTHEDLTPDCNFGANFVNPPFTGDDHGHGTHVAGLAAARDNQIGTIGTAPEASLYSVKVLSSFGSGSWSGVAAGIVWAADNGMHIINMSLGGSSFNQAVADAVAYANGKGVLIVSAAGNAGGCSTCQTVHYPAKYPESMAIAAVDSTDTRATFSSTGPEVDVAAPGVSNLSSVPKGSCSLCDPTGYKRLSGTSMATPHTAGTGALLMSRGLTNTQARARLRDTAIDLTPSGFDWLTGCGRIDAKRAVDNIGSGCGGAPPPPTPTPTPTPPPPPAPECSASFSGSVRHKDPADQIHLFQADPDCTGSFTFTLSWPNDHKDLVLTVVDPAGGQHVSDCCFPEKLILPAQGGSWQLFAGTKSPGRVEYGLTVTN